MTKESNTMKPLFYIPLLLLMLSCGSQPTYKEVATDRLIKAQQEYNRVLDSSNKEDEKSVTTLQKNLDTLKNEVYAMRRLRDSLIQAKVLRMKKQESQK